MSSSRLLVVLAVLGLLAGPAAGEKAPRARRSGALKQRMILDAIAETGSKTKAAEQLGIPRQSLQKMMKRLGLS